MNIPKLLTVEETAQYLGVTPSTLAVWRVTGRYALVYIKVGRLVKYRAEDVHSFIESRKHGG